MTSPRELLPQPAPQRPRVVLICHANAPLDREGMTRWLASFADLVGVVELRDTTTDFKKRIRREWQRSGALGLADVTAFRIAYRLTSAKSDATWEHGELERLRDVYPAVDAPLITADNPNTPDVEAFIRAAAPDLMIARCKFLLKPRIFDIPRCATLVLHPGVCPEYRNAHGGFWALAKGDYGRVGATLLKVDSGIDTGPVYATYTYPYDALAESHIRIQQRCVFDNLPAIATKLSAIANGTAAEIETTGRASAVWGQPRLTAHWRAQRLAHQHAASNLGQRGVPTQ